MRTVSLFVLIVAALALVGCQGGLQRGVGTSAAYTPAAQSQPAPYAPAVTTAYEAPTPATTGPNGERVLQTVMLPKGKTPYDMGLDTAPPAGEPAAVFETEPAPAAEPVAATPPEQVGPNGERVLKMVVLPKGQTPYEAGLADAPHGAE